MVNTFLIKFNTQRRPTLAIAVLLSINLAILNILPIPALDGGRLIFVILEWVRRGKRVLGVEATRVRGAVAAL